jgi:hypothetical protein
MDALFLARSPLLGKGDISMHAMVGSIFFTHALDSQDPQTISLPDFASFLNILPLKSIQQWSVFDNAAATYIKDNDARTSEKRAQNVYGVSRDQLANVSNNISNYEAILAKDPQGIVFFTFLSAFLFNGFCAFQSCVTNIAKIFVYDNSIKSYQKALQSVLPENLTQDLLALSAQLNAASELNNTDAIKQAEEKILILVNKFAREHRELTDKLLKEKTEARITSAKLDKTLQILDAVAKDAKDDEVNKAVNTFKSRYNLRSSKSA